ncbi:MAG TPA: sterol carrier family protein [Frankiaceae bacterium]|nr:sterol carrier family protein [Frankiaceae bacterium]
MSPSRRVALPVDPAPLLADVWRRTVAGIGGEPDAGTRAAAAAELASQLAEAARVLARPGRASGARTLAEYLAAIRATGPALRPDDASPHALLQLVDEATGALGTAKTGVVEGPAGPVERQVFLEERLIAAVALGRDLSDPLVPEHALVRLVVRLLARALAELAPGRSVELRIPPHVAVQCVEGPRHTRGTPPNVVEVEPVAFLELATGRRSWESGVTSGLLRASGERADLRPWLPLVDSRIT